MAENENRNEGRREGGFRPGGRKPYGGKPGERRSHDGASHGGRKPYQGGKPGDKGPRDGRKPFSGRDGGSKSFSKGDGERKSFKRDGFKPRGEGKPFKRDKDGRSFRKEGEEGFERGGRKPFDRDGRKSSERSYDGAPRKDAERGFGRDDRSGRGERKPFERDGKGREFDRGPRRDDDRRREFDRAPRRDDDRARREPDPDRIMPRDAYKSHEADAPNGGKATGRPPEGARKYDRSYRSRKPKNAWQKGATPGRQAALKVLRIVRERDAFAHDLIVKHIDSSPMSREDRAFATRLVLGVVSARGTLDEVIDRNLNTPDDVQDDVRDALRISAYEIVFLDKDPWAAVDQGVELVKEVAPQAGGLANAVLRKVVASKEAFPYGNPAADLGAFARKYAFPAWLAKRLVADLGPEVARDLMAASNEPAPLFVAVNPLRATEREMVELLEAAHGAPTPAFVDERPVEGCYLLAEGRVLVDGRVARAINQGKLFVSDATSQMVANLVLPEEKPASMLEIGAGRGTKTLLLQGAAQRRWGSQVEEYATLDNHAFKTGLLVERAEAYGVQVSEPRTGNALDLAAVFGDRTFDVVFVDAPCSGLGTLRRHPEIRWRTSEEAIANLAETGGKLIAEAAGHVAVGGRLAYATCTVTHAENNAVVTGFLSSEAGKNFRLVPLFGKGCFATALRPGAPDAHFLVVMERVS